MNPSKSAGRSPLLAGYFAAIGSGMLFGINPSFRLMATDAGMGVPAVIAVSMACGMVLSILLLLFRRQKILLPLKPVLKLLLAGVIGSGLTGYLLLLSYSYISSGSSVIIHFTYPTLTCIAGVLFFQSKLTWKKIAAVVLSLTGVILISGGIGKGSLTGVLIAFASAVTFGGYSLFLAHDPDLKVIPSAQQLPYLLCGATLISLILCAIGGNWGSFSGVAFAGCLFSGLCVLFATLLFTLAVRRIDAAPTGFCSLFEPITCVLIGVFLRNEPMTLLIAVGIVVSLSAVLITVWDGMSAKDSR